MQPITAQREPMDLEAMDNAVTGFVNGLAGHAPVLDGMVVAVTTYGAFAIVAAVAIRWWWNGGADNMRERHLAILCGASAALGLAMNQGVLLVFQRVRPYGAGVSHLLVPPSADPSFPSDHAMLAFAVAFALLGAGARRGWAFLIAAVLLSASRVYIGTHYVSDVLGGALTAAVAVLVCLALLPQESRLTKMASRVL